MIRRILALLGIFAMPAFLVAQPVPKLVRMPGWIAHEAVLPPLPDGAFARLATPRFVLPHGHTPIALSPDGKQVAVGTYDRGGALIWDVDRAGEPRQTEPFIEQWPAHVAWSPTGRFIAAVKHDGAFRIWHAASGRSLWPGKGRKLDLPNSRDLGFRFIQGDRQLAAVWQEWKSMAWRVEIWDIEADRHSSSFTFDKDRRDTLGMPAGYDIRHVALSPKGEHVVWLAAPAPTAKDGGSIVWVFETATGKLLHMVKDLPRSHRAALPDDGKTLVLLPIRADKVDPLVPGKATVVNCADGRVKFHVAYRYRSDTWGGEGSGVPGVIQWVEQAAARLGGALLTVDEVGLSRWDFDSGKKLDDYSEPTHSFAVSADEKRIAVRSWRRLRVGGEGTLPIPGDVALFSRAPAVRFLPDGRLMGQDATNFDDGMFHIWDPRKQTLLESSLIHGWPGDFDDGVSMDLTNRRFIYLNRKPELVIHDRVMNRPVATAPVLRGARLSNDGKRILATTPEPGGLGVRWYDADKVAELGAYVIPKADANPRLDHAEWFSADGSVFGYETADGGLALVECASGKKTVVLRPSPDHRWKKPAWEYQGTSGFHMVWARPQYDAVDEANSSVAEHFLWDRQGHLLRRFSLPAAYKNRSMQLVTPDGRSMIVRTGSEIFFFETATQRLRGRLQWTRPASNHGPQAVDVSPDCSMMATSGDNWILLWNIARPLGGKPAHATPLGAKQAEALWETLGDPDPVESDRALWALVAAPELAVPMLKERLKPVPPPDAKLVRALIEKLDSANFVERNAAQKELRGMKETALSILRAARTSASAEQGRRLDDVIADMQARLELPDAMRSSLRELRALEVLDRIGTPEARKLVEALANGADAVPTHEAQLILTRWAKIP